ncbi:MAG: WD40-repeat-containing domain protein [Linnemannia elongata]|nr:MAG: WD40-repeat-containing domain protein [Linnemannia elongata]
MLRQQPPLFPIFFFSSRFLFSFPLVHQSLSSPCFHPCVCLFFATRCFLLLSIFSTLPSLLFPPLYHRRRHHQDRHPRQQSNHRNRLNQQLSTNSAMDIVSCLPVEIAHQVLSNLDIQDVAACQQVSRQWYWIAIDPLVWKNVFLERERTFAIPTGSYSFPTKGKGVVQKPSEALSTLTTPATISGSNSSSSSSSFSSLSSVSFSGLKSRLTGAITTATSTTASAATTPPAAAQSAATVSETTSTLNTTLNTDNSMIMSTMGDRDWKKECRTRIMSDRNWARGHIQAVFTLKVHKGAISRLRIKSGKLLSADMFGQVAVWDTTTYKCEGVIEAAVGPILLLDFSTVAMVMTAISKSGVCRIWDIRSKRLIHSSTATYVTCMTMNDEYLIMGSKSGEIQVIDFMTGQVVASTVSFPGETVRHFAFCPIDT